MAGVGSLRTLVGTLWGDDLAGTGQPDTLDGRGGDDTLTGLGGGDLLYGGTGTDSLYGGAGTDHLDGGRGGDWLYGGDDDDLLTVGLSVEELALNRLFGGAGNDSVAIVGVSRAVVDAGDGDDSVTLDSLAFTADLDGGAGWDRIEIAASGGAGIALDLVAGTLEVDGRDIGGARGFEEARLVGGDADDAAVTLDGADFLYMGGGANRVSAGAGDDWVVYFAGEAGTYDGGTGTDTLEIAADPDRALTLRAITGTDSHGSTFANFESILVHGSDRADRIALSDGDDGVYGGRGSDRLRGHGGNDFLEGGDGRDTVLGDAGDDVVICAAGPDLVVGGAGADTVLIYAGGGGPHRFADFEAGVDEIQILGAADDTLVSGPLEPGLLSFDAAVGTHGQYVLLDRSADDLLVWDGNGAAAGGVVELLILTGESHLSAGDLVSF